MNFDDPIDVAIFVGCAITFPIAFALGWAIGWGRGYRTCKRDILKKRYPQ